MKSIAFLLVYFLFLLLQIHAAYAAKGSHLLVNIMQSHFNNPVREWKLKSNIKKK